MKFAEYVMWVAFIMLTLASLNTSYQIGRLSQRIDAQRDGGTAEHCE